MTIRKARSRHSRSSTGCSTCKLRHLKCDEGFPCRRCLAAGWQCDGPRSTTDLVFRIERPDIVRQCDAKPLREPSPFTWLANSQERRAFEFYIQKAGPLLSGVLDWDLWGSLVPCLAESDVTVRYILLAMSHFCEHPIRTSEHGKIQIHSLSSRHVVALQWQARAISLDRQRNPRTGSSDFVLKHVLLSCHEFQQNNYRGGWGLLRVAYSLVAPWITSGCDNSTKTTAPSDPIMQVLLPCMLRNLCLLFNPWNRSLNHALHLKSLEEVEADIFNHICAVYASVKIDFFAFQSRAVVKNGKLAAKRRDLRSVLLQLRAATSTVPSSRGDQVQSTRRRALHEYCDIGIHWLNIMTDIVQSAANESCFLQMLLEATKRLDTTATTLFPAAASSNFFHSFAIYPTAYFVTIFSRDPQLRSEALKNLNERMHHNSMPHLLAMVRRTEQHTSNHNDDTDMNGAFQIHHGNKDRVLRVDEVGDEPT